MFGSNSLHYFLIFHFQLTIHPIVSFSHCQACSLQLAACSLQLIPDPRSIQAWKQYIDYKVTHMDQGSMRVFWQTANPDKGAG